jgi:hypothetical protein
MTVQDQATTQGILLTGAAAVKVSSLLEQEGRDDLRLRIAVQPGGCAGRRYPRSVDEREIAGALILWVPPLRWSTWHTWSPSITRSPTYSG